MDLFTKFEAYIREQGLFEKQTPLWLAVSGGVDSAVLLHLCQRAGYRLTLLHVNYGLRGQESDLDEALVKTWAVQTGVPVCSVRFDLKPDAGDASAIQEKARDLRYGWFAEKLREAGPACIVTAHHADDQIETLLFRYFRGSGIKGLLGMEPRGGILPELRRPLLFARKKEIIDYARANGLEWREDASNATVAYTRNYLRNEVIPSLHGHFPNFEDVLLQRLNYWTDVVTLYEQQVQQYLKKWVVAEGHTLKVPVLKVTRTKGYATILYEWLKPFGFLHTQLPSILSLLKAESGKFVASGSYRIYRNRTWLILVPVQPDGESPLWIHEDDHSQDIPGVARFQWSIQQEARLPNTTKWCEVLDAGKIRFPLMLRRWKNGDYFYPLGMPHKKKLSRFFIDQKLSIPEKENTWILCSGDHIVWVIGQRIDHRFRVTESTKSVMQVQWLPAT